MAFQTGSQLHYRCNFAITPRQASETAWSDLVKAVRTWIKHVTGTDEGLIRAWFFGGGTWVEPPAQRTHLETAVEVGSGRAASPQFWSLRYEHACNEVPFRQWRTDIGITTCPYGFQFSVTTHHWLLPGYIGKEPDSPVPTAPGIVGSLLRSRDWTCAAGSEPLLARPLVLAAGAGQWLYNRLAATDRSCPIVLVSRNPVPDEPVLSVDLLAKHLGGTAVVYVAQSSVVASEWESALPYSFRCRIGMARVYQPGVKFGNSQDARRHRYFTDIQITELSDEEVRKMIIRGIARRAATMSGASVTSIEDVHAKRRDARLNALRESTNDLKSKDELINLLEQDNTTLASKKRDLESEKTSLQDRIDDLELQLDERDSNVAQQNYVTQKLNGEVTAAQAESAALKLQLSNFQRLETLPTSVGEVVNLIAKLHPGKVVFTKRALESTKSRQISLVPIAWTYLWALATTLHSLVFADQPRGTDFQKGFKDTTGIDFSMTEGKMTKDDKRIMATRRDNYEGKQIDITPHLKYGIEDPKLLRIHFFIDERNRRFIVGHCGGHLDTYGTRRR